MHHLVFCALDDLDGRKKSVDKLLAQLEQAIGEVLDELSVPRESPILIEKQPSRLLWHGLPFVLAGNPGSVDKYLRRLGASAKALLRDCSYYWILTDADKFTSAVRDSISSRDRESVIDLNEDYSRVIAHAIRPLLEWPELAGLSRNLAAVRSVIGMLRDEPGRPGTPILILGDTGTGKSVVAEVVARARGPAHLTTIAGGSLVDTLFRCQFFGCTEHAFTGAPKKGMVGLLASSKGAPIFVDDFDAAPKDVQSALLSIFSSTGAKASYLRVGGWNVESTDHTGTTSSWFLCATNANVQSLIASHELREDFLYRFEHRILTLQPLQDRPADIPALLRCFWGTGWRPYPVGLVEWLCSHSREDLQWTGNTRALRTLVALARGVVTQPGTSHLSLRTAFERIFSLGPDMYHWLGILRKSPVPEAPIASRDLVNEVIALDRDHAVDGSHPATWPATGSELRACSILGPDLEGELRSVIRALPPRGKKGTVRASVRMCRTICYVHEARGIDRAAFERLTQIGSFATMRGDLAPLVALGLLTPRGSGPGASSYLASPKFP